MNYNPNFDPTTAPLALKPKSNGPWIVAFLALAGAGAGGYMLYQGRQHAREDATAATQRAQAAEAEKTELAQKVEKLESEKTELATAKEELSKDVQAKTGELDQLKGTYDKLEDKMKDEIAKGDIRLSQSGGKLRVDLVDKILFDSGEAVISKRGEGVLARVGAVLAAIDDKQIQVSGHTDSKPISEKLAPQFPTNWELSVVARGQRRALPGGEGQRPRQAPDRERLRRVPPDRQQQDRGRARAQPPHRDPADAVAGSEGDREVEAPGRRGGSAGEGRREGAQRGQGDQGNEGRQGRRAQQVVEARQVVERALVESQAGEELLVEAPPLAAGAALPGQARAPTIQHAAVKRTSAPCTYGSKAGRTVATTRARSSSSACWRMRPTGPSWVR